MGYSLRDGQYRFTIWMKNGFRSTKKYAEKDEIGMELYDYKADPLETKNVAGEKKYQSIANAMRKDMLNYFNSQVIK